MSIAVLSVRKYMYYEDIKRYFRNPNIKFDSDDIQNYDTYDEVLNVDEVSTESDIDEVIATYIFSIRTFLTNNEQKAHILTAGIVFLVFSIGFTGSVVFVIFSNQSTGSTNKEKSNGEFTCKVVNSSSTSIITNNTLLNSNNDGNSKIMLCLSHNELYDYICRKINSCHFVNQYKQVLKYSGSTLRKLDHP